MSKKKNGKNQPMGKRQKPLHIPLPFEQIVDAMLRTKPLKKKKK